MSQSLADQLAASALSGGNAAFIEDLYEQFLKGPNGVDPAWAAFFSRLKGGAVDEVRKEERRQLDVNGRKAIKGLRWLLSLHSRNRTKAHTRFLNRLRQSNPRIHRAWVLKDEFEHFWNYRSETVAKRFLKRWMTAALRSRIPSLRVFVTTLRKHFDNVVTFINRPLTNAVGEGLNRIIKIVKNRASGFRTMDSFADMIFLTVGDLDILAQIPSELRTL